jgi:glycine betaine/proline transport system permease protein
MMALALVVLATFIGSPGLGDIVYSGLVRLNVGKALEGGLAIVFMAIVLDRVTYAMGHVEQVRGGQHDHMFRLFPQGLEHVKPILYLEYGIDWIWRQIGAVGNFITLMVTVTACKLATLYDSVVAERLREILLARSFLIASLVLIAILMLLDAYTGVFGKFPRAWEYSFRTPVNQYMDVLVSSKMFYAVTTAIKEGLFYGLINPLNKFLMGLPLVVHVDSLRRRRLPVQRTGTGHRNPGGIHVHRCDRPVDSGDENAVDGKRVGVDLFHPWRAPRHHGGLQ